MTTQTKFIRRDPVEVEPWAETCGAIRCLKMIASLSRLTSLSGVGSHATERDSRSFVAATADRLFDMYLDSQGHAEFTGAAVTIEPRPGAPFRAFDGVLTGTMLHVEPKRLIIQTWRSANWPAETMDSVLTLSFWPEGAGARIELVHVNVPVEDFAGVSQGWEKYYWTPWRAHLNA